MKAVPDWLTVARKRVVRKLRRRRSPYALNLWPIAFLASFWLAVVGLLVSWIYRFMLGAPFAFQPWPIASPQANPDDAARNTAGIVGVVVAILTAVYAYRKQKMAEAEAFREDAIEFSRRYGEALTQLAGEQPSMRLGGAYAMARLADDWRDQRQVCVDVLCAYLRMPFEKEGDAPGYIKGEDQVRNTIQKIIESHVTSRVIEAVSWSPQKFDLTGACLSGVEFQNAIFEAGIDFTNVTFVGPARFDKAVFYQAAKFTGSSFVHGAWFDGVSFLGEAWFDAAGFSREAWFEDVSFAKISYFAEASFSGLSSFSRCCFGNSATFSGTAFAGDVWFQDATFSGNARFETARFCGGAFEGAHFLAEAFFDGTTFADLIRFSRTTFEGPAWFERARFHHACRFDRAVFRTDARFSQVAFLQNAWFEHAKFAGTTSFREVQFLGDSWFGDVSFSGTAPIFDYSYFAGSVDFTDAQFNHKASVEHMIRDDFPGRLGLNS